MSSIFRSFIQVFVALCVVAPVFGHPSSLSSCSRKLVVGDNYMDKAAIVGDAAKIQILDDAGNVRPNGADWFAGMNYTAKLILDAGEEFLADLSLGATSTTASTTDCASRRIYQDSFSGNQEITFQVPSDFTGTYSVTLGYTASSSSPVKVVTTTLVPPPGTPTASPITEIDLLGSCEGCALNLYKAECGAFSKAINECKSTLTEANCCAFSTGDCCETNDGMIAGVAVGAFVFIVLCIFGCYYACNYNSKNGGYDTAQNQEAEIGMQEVNGENGEEQVAVTGESAEDKI